MTDFLFLTVRMVSGFGVDLVVANLCRALQKHGFSCSVACLDMDGTYHDLDIFEIPDGLRSLQKLVNHLKPQSIVAHSSPFYAYLMQLRTSAVRVVWEHGDPDPKYLPETAASDILREKSFKLSNVYPYADRVIAISEFIRKDISWPASTIIYNGADHVPDLGPKRVMSSGPLKIGFLNRLGRSENSYKGTKYYFELVEILAKMSVDCEIHFMGKGTLVDARELIAAGFKVHLNASETEKWSFFRRMDIFVTTSQWEGFNLPLAEAQASGTLAFALRTGAHPEVSSHNFKTIRLMAERIRNLSLNRSALLRDSIGAYNTVRRKFRWDQAAQDFLVQMGNLTPGKSNYRTFWKTWILRVNLKTHRYVQRLQSMGLRRVIRGIWRKLWKVIQRLRITKS